MHEIFEDVTNLKEKYSKSASVNENASQCEYFLSVINRGDRKLYFILE